MGQLYSKILDLVTVAKDQHNLIDSIWDQLTALQCDTIPVIQATLYQGMGTSFKIKTRYVGKQCWKAPARGWGEVQQYYYKWLGIRKVGLRWLLVLFQKL